jgi:hypothetical protein
MSYATYSLKKFHQFTSTHHHTVVSTDDGWKFRFLCFQLQPFMKHVCLPPVHKSPSYYEAVFIEFRILPHLDFILRNAIYCLGSKWAFTVVCGTTNYDFMRTLCTAISPHIRLLRLDHANMTQQMYSNYLMTTAFWNSLRGEKILIFQEDSLFFRRGVDPFLQYDFIGAPFPPQADDTPNSVGNGGLSIRTKCKMLEVLRTCPVEDLVLGQSTQTYMEYVQMTAPPEDVYFSKNLQERSIGDVADWDTARDFSSETVYNPTSFAGHKFWVSDPQWKQRIKETFRYFRYRAKSDLDFYLQYHKLPAELNKNKDLNCPNAFDLDFYFFCLTNNITYVNAKTTATYLANISLDGFIYHPKQLLNIFPHIELYHFMHNIYVIHEKKIQPVQRFVDTHLYHSDFDYLSNALIQKQYDTLNDNYDILLLVFLGNETLSADLLKRVARYKRIQTHFNVAFCINTQNIRNKQKIKQFIKREFDFYAIYYSREMGTDITPTMLMYYEITKTHRFQHILKFHTKTISDIYLRLTNYLTTTPLQRVLEHRVPHCHCINHVDSYLFLKDDRFNQMLKKRHAREMHVEHSFVAGTIFYAEARVLDRVLQFIQTNNYRCYLLNNLYENNSINHAFSPIHFLERLFGTIKVTHK